ncbi:ABC transporter ATP-binding protein [Geobacillus icigianus]|uniref:Oligosaccharides import ATP-binding protein MsmX n=1 Tax=Geobacillus icigianus TaxID=1430331 RepID=A0ABU6BDE2_9BACL|nr:ABC transporter ATP-binding protein [Geobacillus icigianus]MEB3749719.1 Oligosaccharides import ATP-binding protein MsmX [Geobacillus icigianus]
MKIELINVSKIYKNDVKAVSDVNVTIESGEFFVLLGPSGCGKSTLLRMIAGLEDITEGILKMDGMVANNLDPSERNLSMVFQNYALYPHLTVEENILFGLYKKKNMSKTEKIKKCKDVAEMMGLEQYLKRKPRELSGGQRQRVALARAVVSEDPVCLMDEPLSNLDAKLRTNMRKEIKQLQKRLGITMIYVTHDQVEAMTMGDKIMVLRNGRVQQIGKPLEIYNAPSNTFVASFIGAPPMNLIPGCIENGEIILDGGHRLGSLRFQQKRSIQEIIVGIRPEHLNITDVNNRRSINFNFSVKYKEILGTETIITVELGRQEMFIRCNGQVDIPIGKEVGISVETDKICIFDKETGMLINQLSDNLNDVKMISS